MWTRERDAIAEEWGERMCEEVDKTEAEMFPRENILHSGRRGASALAKAQRLREDGEVGTRSVKIYATINMKEEQLVSAVKVKKKGWEGDKNKRGTARDSGNETKEKKRVSTTRFNAACG